MCDIVRVDHGSKSLGAVFVRLFVCGARVLIHGSTAGCKSLFLISTTDGGTLLAKISADAEDKKHSIIGVIQA
jgi:hypothetical protein